MLEMTITGIMVAIVMGLVRAFRGPSLYDRILAVQMIGTKTLLIVAVLGFMASRPEFLDIVLVYVLISFVSTIAVLRYCGPSSTDGADQSGEGNQ